MPTQMLASAQDVLRQWQHLAADPLPPKKDAHELRAARKLSRRSANELRLETQLHTQNVLTHLRRFKYELTHNRWTEMLDSAKELKHDVHSLRICVRAKNLQSSASTLPPRAAQYQSARLPKYALAWANALDMYLVQAGCNPGPLIVFWNMQICVSPIPPVLVYAERNHAEALRRDRTLLQDDTQAQGTALREARVRKERRFAQGLLLDEIMTRIEPPLGLRHTLEDPVNFGHVTQAVGRLRSAVMTYQHPTMPLPPHPEQYSVAGNHWATNRRHWRQAMREWLMNVDEAYPPAYEAKDATLPSYSAANAVLPPHKMRWPWGAAPWTMWPSKLLPRPSKS